ncbi:MAG: tRNA pseudouridine(55) synthase TruB [Treponema sp.]|jgi:tRNA pseudouridine55 synthase|nr:tRNA pseudouridine(55) synthase TruB [Treponema sp.]
MAAKEFEENAGGGGEKSGLLLLRKKSGLTSFEALYPVKRALGTGKVGHTGTLDKFAEGLLLVLIGRAVKLTPWFSGCEKTYEGVIRFGLETDTLDPEGLPIAEAVPPSREDLEAVLPAFRGEILQRPPAYSAVHLGGKRASRLARSGVEPILPERPVCISELNLLSYEMPLARIRVRCSKGTYIRSLARDIALAARSRGHLISLNRNRVGGFDLSQSFELSPEDETFQSFLINALRPLDETVFEALGLPYFFIEDRDLPNMIRGKNPETFIDEAKLRFGTGEDFAAGVFFSGGFAGIMEKKAGKWVYGYVYVRG